MTDTNPGGDPSSPQECSASQAAAADASADAAGDERNDPVTLVALREELQQAQQRALRAQAELENFRKRARRDMEEERRYAHLPLIQDLLTVLDNLDRAIEAAERHEQESGLLEGVRMVARQFEEVLERYECRRIGDLGLPFDPNLHEAIGQEPNDALPPGTVARVARTGYQLGERVVRPTQVMISSGPALPPSSGAGGHTGTADGSETLNEDP